MVPQGSEARPTSRLSAPAASVPPRMPSAARGRSGSAYTPLPQYPAAAQPSLPWRRSPGAILRHDPFRRQLQK